MNGAMFFKLIMRHEAIVFVLRGVNGTVWNVRVNSGTSVNVKVGGYISFINIIFIGDSLHDFLT